MKLFNFPAPLYLSQFLFSVLFPDALNPCSVLPLMCKTVIQNQSWTPRKLFYLQWNMWKKLSYFTILSITLWFGWLTHDTLDSWWTNRDLNRAQLLSRNASALLLLTVTCLVPSSLCSFTNMDNPQLCSNVMLNTKPTWTSYDSSPFSMWLFDVI